MDFALQQINSEGGVLVYIRGHEGRGIGLLKKLSAYRLQDAGLDTVAANLALDEPADGREYGGAAAVLADLGLSSVRLLTNNPAKIVGLEDNGIRVSQRIPVHVGANVNNVRYLEAKRRWMGHSCPGADWVADTDESWPLLFAGLR